MTLTGMKLADISDREVLLILNDVSDHEGWAESREIAAKLDIKHDRRNALVGARLGWLYRYGAVEREYKLHAKLGHVLYTKEGKPRYTQRWRLTDIGEALAFGSLNKSEHQRLEKLQDEQLLLVTRYVASRALQAPDTARILTHREWRHSMDPQRLSRNGARPR